MSVHVAKNGVIEIEASAVAFVEDISEDASNALVGSPVMGQVYVGHKGTQTTYTYSFTLKEIPGETSHAAIVPGAEVSLSWYPDGNSTGNQKMTVDVVIGSVGKSYSASGESKRSVSASSQGVPVITTVA